MEENIDIENILTDLNKDLKISRKSLEFLKQEISKHKEKEFWLYEDLNLQIGEIGPSKQKPSNFPIYVNTIQNFTLIPQKIMLKLSENKEAFINVHHTLWMLEAYLKDSNNVIVDSNLSNLGMVFQKFNEQEKINAELGIDDRTGGFRDYHLGNTLQLRVSRYSGKKPVFVYSKQQKAKLKLTPQASMNLESTFFGFKQKLLEDAYHKPYAVE
jgi:hypothetical protein